MTLRRDGLAAAACALLGAGATAGAAKRTGATEIDASILYWSEGSRVTVNEGIFNLRTRLSNDRTLDFGLVVDVMTGASPNGATRANTIQTFTRPSGRGGYVTDANRTPVDDTFQDNRVAGNVRFGAPLGRATTATFGAYTSIEYDYGSTGADTHISRDFNRRNTTLGIGIAAAWDEMTPEGGIPVPFASMTAPGETPPRVQDTDSRSTYDLLISATQVLTRATLLRVNYNYNRSRGYHTDPFKLMSMVDGTPGPTEGDPTDYVFENRPRERERHAAFALVKHAFGRSAGEASYRYTTDDWDVQSHTLELRYRAVTDGGTHAGRYIEPQYRLYKQTAAASFYHFLRDDTPTPTYASADLRLGEFYAQTLAIKAGMPLDGRSEVNLRIGYYRQIGDRSPPEAFGSLVGIDLFPTVGAMIIQLGYSARL